MRKGPSLGLVIAVIGSGALTTVALGAPTNSKLPTISGKPAFGSVLTCNKGTWSTDAVSFDYSWVYSGDGPTIATGQKWLVNSAIGYNISCQVVAHDAHGATTAADSAQVLLTPGISSVRITKTNQRHGTVSITAVAGPSAALKHASVNRPVAVLQRKIPHSKTVLQIAGPLIIKNKNGHFTISGHDTAGKHTYILHFLPAPSSQYAESQTTKLRT